MSGFGERMIRELQAIRKALEGSQPLGFGKKVQPVYVFVKHSSESLWYSRDRSVGENVPIVERDLTGYLINVWRFDRTDEATGETVPKLNILVRADKDYIIQSGFSIVDFKGLVAQIDVFPSERGHLTNPETRVRA